VVGTIGCMVKNSLQSAALEAAKSSEFDLVNDDPSVLEIHEASGASGFHYFYHPGERRLIKSFLLREGSRVATLCAVTLIGTDHGFQPRFRFWKQDRTTARKTVIQEEVELPTAEAATSLVKASVDLGDCFDTLWKLIRFLESFSDVMVPGQPFKVATGDTVDLAAALQGREKDEILIAVKKTLGAGVTEQDLQMLSGRKDALVEFERMLEDPAYFAERMAEGHKVRPEDTWQAFFEENTWIFGYGLALVACEGYTDTKLEAITTGASVFSGAGKRVDAAMRTRGFIQGLLFAEIKRPETNLLDPAPYRPPDVYRPSGDLTGAVSQVQKTTMKAIGKIETLHRQNSPSGEFQFEVSTVRPRQIVICGHLRQLFTGGAVNQEQLSSFELFRRGLGDVEVITFDELLERARFIARSDHA
jgi:hypothetical protein